MGSKKKPLTETVTISAIAETAHEAVKVARQILAYRGVSRFQLEHAARDSVVRGAWNVTFIPKPKATEHKVTVEVGAKPIGYAVSGNDVWKTTSEGKVEQISVVNMKPVEGKPHTHEGTIVFDKPGQVGLSLRADEEWDGEGVLSSDEAAAKMTKRISKILGPPTPEHDKLKKVSGESQAIGEFVDWLRQERGIVFCDEDKVDDVYVPVVPFSIERVLADYFGIDLNKIEQEKVALLDHIRAQNEGKR